MQTQYVITLGAHSKNPTAKDSWKAGKFDSKDYAHINKIVRQRGFPGSTILKGTGFWQGHEEDSVQIIILADDYAKQPMPGSSICVRLMIILISPARWFAENPNVS